MRTSYSLIATVVVALILGNVLVVTAFQPFALPTTTRRRLSSVTTVLYQYIPDGFTKESFAKFKADEAKKAAAAAKKNLGSIGPKGFKSRSMQSFQEALERGESAHLFPVFNAKEKVKKGELKVEDIPYMQRGGAWDNSDVKGAKKKKWLPSDKEYDAYGFKKSQSASILGMGDGLDWAGNRGRTGPNGGGAANNNQKPESKKLFGLF